MQHIEALKGVDLTVPKGSTVGIIGRNGSGKSTLLKVITGIYRPTSGALQVNGRISALLELGAGFHPDFTGRENIMINGIILGMNRNEVKARIDGIIAFAELGDFIDEPVRTYSSGMFMRLAFAVATHVDPEILIVDEILSVGDEHFAKKSQAKMTEFKTAGKTILLVTHSLNTVERWCDLAVWVDGGRTRMVGAPAKVVAEYKRAVNAAEAEIEKTGHSALSAPGLALPEVTQPQPAQEGLRAVSVSVVDGSGQRPRSGRRPSRPTTGSTCWSTSRPTRRKPPNAPSTSRAPTGACSSALGFSRARSPKAPAACASRFPGWGWARVRGSSARRCTRPTSPPTPPPRRRFWCRPPKASG